MGAGFGLLLVNRHAPRQLSLSDSAQAKHFIQFHLGVVGHSAEANHHRTSPRFPRFRDFEVLLPQHRHGSVQCVRGMRQRVLFVVAVGMRTRNVRVLGAHTRISQEAEITASPSIAPCIPSAGWNLCL